MAYLRTCRTHGKIEMSNDSQYTPLYIERRSDSVSSNGSQPRNSLKWPSNPYTANNTPDSSVGPRGSNTLRWSSDNHNNTPKSYLSRSSYASTVPLDAFGEEEWPSNTPTGLTPSNSFPSIVSNPPSRQGSDESWAVRQRQPQAWIATPNNIIGHDMAAAPLSPFELDGGYKKYPRDHFSPTPF